MPSRAGRHQFKLSERRDPAARVVIAALFAPLVLLLIVTAMTWRSERRIAVVTDRVVHDYAAMAVWQYARHASRTLHDEAMEAVSHMPEGTRVGPEMSAQLGHPSTLLAGRGSTDNVFVERADLAFTFEADSDRLTIAGADPSEATLAMLRRQLGAVMAGATKGEEPHHVRFDSADGRGYAIALSLVWLADASIAAKGTVVQSAALDRMFAGVIRDADLLPAVTGRRALDRDGIALRLTRPDGATVFATRAPLANTAAVDTTGIQNGVLHATLDLPPAVARELLVGAAPGSLLPPLGLMLLMAGALAGTGLAHQRRSRALEQARARFVANVSHELRTPLAQISMFAETLHL